MRNRSHSGFTLVELLVVVAIISLLIAMLMPALQAARAQAQSINCMSRMRQYHMAVIQYANDHKQTLPGYWLVLDNSWTPLPTGLGRLEYMPKGNQFWGWDHEWALCPAPPAGRTGDNPLGRQEFIAYNAYLGWSRHVNNATLELYRVVNLTQVRQSAKTVMITDAHLRTSPTHNAYGFYFIRSTYPPTGTGTSQTYKHRESANYLFVDGHGETLTKEEANRRTLDTRYPFIRPFPP